MILRSKFLEEGVITDFIYIVNDRFIEASEEKYCKLNEACPLPSTQCLAFAAFVRN